MVKTKQFRSTALIQRICASVALLVSSTLLSASDDTNAWNQILALKNVPFSDALGTKQYADTVDLVKKLVDTQGSSVLLKLLNSSSQDDYLRQATIAGALKATYTYQDLPNLCAMERILAALYQNVHEKDRRWIEPEVAQLRVADWIEYLSRIPDNERISKNELLSNTDSWIRKTVSAAKNHLSNSTDADVLNSCLSN